MSAIQSTIHASKLAKTLDGARKYNRVAALVPTVYLLIAEVTSKLNA
jgi:hypothetical protein